jgi:hypothetical protein
VCQEPPIKAHSEKKAEDNNNSRELRVLPRITRALNIVASGSYILLKMVLNRFPLEQNCYGYANSYNLNV